MFYNHSGFADVGSRTECCGTLHKKHRILDEAPWTDTLSEHSFKYDRNHPSTLPYKPNIFFQSAKKNIMVNCIKCSRQVQKDQYCCFTLINGDHNIILHTNQSCFGTVTSSTCRLPWLNKVTIQEIYLFRQQLLFQWS